MIWYVLFLGFCLYCLIGMGDVVNSANRYHFDPKPPRCHYCRRIVDFPQGKCDYCGGDNGC